MEITHFELLGIAGTFLQLAKPQVHGAGTRCQNRVLDHGPQSSSEFRLHVIVTNQATSAHTGKLNLQEPLTEIVVSADASLLFKGDINLHSQGRGTFG